MEDWITIKNLKKKNPLLGTRKISELLEVSRNTVKKVLNSTGPPVYKRIKKINPDIEPFREYILQQITIRGLKGSRILKDIISKGYKGSSSAFYRFLKSENLKEKRTFCPYETQPAEQAQFDWSPYTVIISGQLTKIYVFIYILGYSRYRIYEASLSATQAGVFEALENSISELGGSAYRLQTDNAKCFITNPARNNFQFNPRYLAFCGHYSFKPTRSAVRHPWSKGKVENPFYYLEEHFIKGNEFLSFEDFLYRLKQFQEEVNNRTHSTTKKTPSELFENEKSLLLEPPETRYVGVKEEVRKVTSDCLFNFSGSRYSVPSLFANREVWLKISRGYILKVYSSNNILIAEHKLSLEKGKMIINESHYVNHNIERGNFQRLSQLFLNKFPEHQWFIEKLKAQKRINYIYHITQIVELSNYYKSADMIDVFSVCNQYNVYTYNFIKGYLEKHVKIDLEVIETSVQTEYRVEKTEHSVRNIKRSLSEYKLFNK